MNHDCVTSNQCENGYFILKLSFGTVGSYDSEMREGRWRATAAVTTANSVNLAVTCDLDTGDFRYFSCQSHC